MNILKVTAVIFMIIFLPGWSLATDLGSVRISYMEGDVQVNGDDSSEWFGAALNMPLREGDRLWVPEGGKVELQFRDGTEVRLNERTSFDLVRMETDSLQAYVPSGQVYVNTSGQRRTPVQIDTPVASLRSYERSKYKMVVAGDGFTEVSVLRGTAYAEGKGGMTAVRSGKTLSIGYETYANLAPLGPADEWERWNTGRDERYADRSYTYSRTYLPDELRTYSSDFDEYGKWVYVREYGYCWTPTVVVSGWAPYRTGRWVWIGGDYVWISSEPWGWAPYHYGRWAFGVSTGWYWVPPARGSVYWGPGYVGWVHTPTYVAWVPLAPYETYYGYGHHGPHSVNIKQVTINREVTHIYKNVYVNNGVTVVNHDTFLTGRRSEVRVKENPFLTHKISVGRPAIEPVRESRMPALKEVSITRQPPQKVRETQVTEIRKSRPLVSEKGKSVMRPDALSKEMTVRSVKEARPASVERKPAEREQRREPEISRGKENGEATRARPADRDRRRMQETGKPESERGKMPEARPELSKQRRHEGTSPAAEGGRDAGVKSSDQSKRRGQEATRPEREGQRPGTQEMRSGTGEGGQGSPVTRPPDEKSRVSSGTDKRSGTQTGRPEADRARGPSVKSPVSTQKPAGPPAETVTGQEEAGSGKKSRNPKTDRNREDQESGEVPR